MPGRDYSVNQKVRAAKHLDRLGVRYIQPGFPATGAKDQEVVSNLVGAVDAEIMSLARAVDADVEAAVQAGTEVIEIIVPLSDKHLEYTVGKSRETMLNALDTAVEQAQAAGVTVHIGIMDAFRTDLEILEEVFNRFPDVALINLPDTVGARTPASVGAVLEELDARVDLGRSGVHFHDDLGVGTANVLTAQQFGVAKADVSVASLGERAGNSSLEELVVAGTIDLDESFGVAPAELIPVCLEVLDILEESVDPRKPVLGGEVTKHEAGLHTAAMLEDPSVFEPFDPSEFGGERRLVFGTGTGQGGARKLLERAGVPVTSETIDQFLDLLAEQGPLETEAALHLATDEFGA